MADEEKDPGTGGPKMSKSGGWYDEREKQRQRLYDKYLDAQIAWCRDLTAETLEAYERISDEYKRQYDR